jgi:hypothetical protein
MITTKGKGLWANALGDATNGFTGTSTTTTGTTLKVSGAPGWGVNQFAGQDVYTGAVVGTILSNTATVLTVARWETPGATRGGAAAETPAEGLAFSIASGATPAAWLAVSADAVEPKAENETLKGEIKKAGGGLLRALATFTYLGANKYKVEATFTANAEDVTPVILAKIGIFNAQNGGIMLFESLLSSTAEIHESTDAVTITDIVTGT